MNVVPQKSFDSIRNSLEVVLDNDLISSEQFKKAKNDFLKSPSDFTLQYRYGVAMVHSKDKANIEEGLKFLKELCLFNTLHETCMCYYHICFGSLRLHKFPDVQLYAEKLRQECPNLNDESASTLLLDKTELLVMLAEEFIHNPLLTHLLESKRKWKIKGLWKPKRETPIRPNSQLYRNPSVAFILPKPKDVLADSTNYFPLSSTQDGLPPYGNAYSLPALPSTAKKSSSNHFNSLCIRTHSKNPRNLQSSFTANSTTNLPEYQESVFQDVDTEYILGSQSHRPSRRIVSPNGENEVESKRFRAKHHSFGDTSGYTPKSALSSQPMDEILNDAHSDENIYSSKYTPKFESPPIRPYKSVHIPTTIQPNRRRHPITKSITSKDRSDRPWVIIRRYGMRGGKKIRLPLSMDELLKVAGEKFEVDAVSIREVATEAEIDDINAIEPQALLWVMTEGDEEYFR